MPYNNYFSYPLSCNLFPLCYTNCYGALAQLGARHIRIVEVVSSNLICSIFSMIVLLYIPAKAMTAIKPVMTVIFYFIGNSFSYKVKMLRRDATRVELKMHLRAHTGAQRVTK